MEDHCLHTSQLLPQVLQTAYYCKLTYIYIDMVVCTVAVADRKDNLAVQSPLYLYGIATEMFWCDQSTHILLVKL